MESKEATIRKIKIDIVKDSQAYLSRSPVFKKVEVPKSIRNIAKGGKKDYYISNSQLKQSDKITLGVDKFEKVYNINYWDDYFNVSN